MKNNDTTQFYDSMAQQMVDSYLQGNLRLRAAILHVLRWLPKHAGRILEIGCGVGWMAHELSRHFPGAEIEAFDLSQNLMATAQKLFAAPNLHFRQSDVFTFPEREKFDVLVLVDVFEHIAAAQRGDFYEKLNRLLQPNGRVILTCPTAEYQHYLRAHDPGSLQPVDEDVGERVLSEMAAVIGGRLAYFQVQNIWRDGDYFHAVVERGKVENSSVGKHFQLETAFSRARRVRKKLSLSVNWFLLLKAALRPFFKP